METVITTQPTKPKPAAEPASNATEVAEAFDEFMTAFEAFRSANDERLERIETRVSHDVVTTDKVERIGRAMDEHKAALDRLTLKSLRPALGGRMPSPHAPEHTVAFDGYVRRGAEHGLRGLESKALAVTPDPDGGYLVPEEIETRIAERLSEVSPIRAIATVRQVSGSVLKLPHALGGMSVGWVGEQGPRPQTQAPQLDELRFPTMELYAMPAATPSILEDAAMDVDAWITGEVEAAFAEQEGRAFVLGDGQTQPHGFLSYPTVDEANWSWGSIGTVESGAPDGIADPDALLDLVYALKSGYRQNASFVMNRRTQAAVRKLKDGDGNYLWAPPAGAEARATLLGFPIVEAEDMPDIADGNSAIAFGDFARGYLVVDRTGVRVLRDPFSAKPYVLFYTTKRVGGGVQDFDAIKLMRFAA